MPRLRRFSSLFTPIRKSLLDRSDIVIAADPFGPLDEVRRKRKPAPPPLAAPVGPGAPNRPADVGRVEGALERTGVLGGTRRRPLFNTRLETGVRDFQRRKRLKVDGLLNPGGPTVRALGRALARPPLKGLSGEAVAANGRLVRHLMGTTADGMVPDLMVGDFRHGETGRAKTADFLGQLFRRDPARAQSLRAKARGMMETGEKSLLDELILQGRMADEDDGDDQPPEEEPLEPTPDDPGQDDPEEPGEPEKPDEPEKPEKPEPDCEAEEEAVESAQEELENAEAHFESAEVAVADTELDISLTERKIAETEQSIQKNKDNIASIEGEIEIQKNKARFPNKATRPMAFTTISMLNDEIEDLKEEIEQAGEKLKTLRAELVSLKETLAERQKDVADAKESLEQAQAALKAAEEALSNCENQDG